MNEQVSTADALTRDDARAEQTAFASRVDTAMAATTAALRRYLAARVERAGHVATPYAQLWEALGEQVGGKLMRPRLTVAAYLGLGGTDVEAVASIAAAQELLHTAMLTHDDLIDHDEVRRGRPNLAGSHRAALARAGVTGRAADDQVAATGLLGGDLALASAFELVASAPVDPALRVAVVGLMARSIGTTVAGELLDVGAELRSPSAVDALRIAELKTAAYSCIGPLNAGAVLAQAPPSAHVRLERFGRSLGIAFQLVDDDLGVFGDPARTGKSTLSDLREGKRTELLRLTYLLADDAGRALLDRLVGDPSLEEAGAAQVRAVMTASGARDRSTALASGAARSAREGALRTLPQPLAGYLAALVDELDGRGS
ncbi:polyprenyl synthetase family protein [Cellulomonas chengniuliangii]|uniref:Polyprenyl synthetase family protein n=1 Tax=Cellulomonas chengniuliangii TaxID=2968084 RepID=A0ABY5KZP3_9CELL|nr:polyprenyl synthetase family protein [Cellulomonas chengniuliangii]MCC2307603.1 polyprenyl synthetase family protein [Cellulomonas chengniuliangii]MCC2318712.1 polyprenyl synthetase family protein [Cellulomonas chengniuliangii]UUI75629.1 polyprenyl synthetase family protein [Cellulomonas chengniuliangii]